MSFLFAKTIKNMYLLGPTSLGGWGGMALPDICASLTTTPAHFWDVHLNECYDLIERNVTGVNVVCDTLLYFFLFYRIVTSLTTYMFYVRPVMSLLTRKNDCS